MQNQASPPIILVLFGITSDLAHKMIIPALYHLERHSKLPRFFRIVGVSRQDLTGAGISKLITAAVKSSQKKPQTSALKKLINRFSTIRGDAESLSTYESIKSHLNALEGGKVCANRLWYFSTLPQLYETIVTNLEKSGVLSDCLAQGRNLRILVEKPFGHDYASARKLNSELGKYFAESHIYRIDHYVGKETVQNLIVARFANSIFEPLWNKDYIDYIEISALESEGLEQRGDYFDGSGTLSDMVQNHILQLLALTAMDEPVELRSELIRKEKTKILQALSFDASSIVRGQFQDYKKTVGRESQTETFVALKAKLELPRWKNVPIYLRTGKKLGKKITEISIHFKELPKCLFVGCAGNVLTFRIQPDESVYLQINNKVPGFGVKLHQGKLEFSYNSNFKTELPSAYERLLLDFLQGDQRLFISSEEVEASWKFVDKVRSVMNKTPLIEYKEGSNGPKEAEEILKKDGREWHTK